MPQDLTGNKFNYLTVIKKTNKLSGTNYLWECRCDCGNIAYATAYALKSGHKKSCGCFHFLQAKELGESKGVDLLGKTFGDLCVIEKTNQRADRRIMWRCQCSCGNVILVKSSYLTQGKKTHCGCKTVRSLGEQKIKDIFDNNNIVYIMEKTFPDLIYNGKLLRYDFFVENSYLIEFDGKQHFIYDETGYGKELEQIKIRDNIKTQYALDNNIPLIRIPYTELDCFSLNDLQLTSNYMVREEKT